MSEMIIYQDDSGTTNLEVKLEKNFMVISNNYLSYLM